MGSPLPLQGTTNPWTGMYQKRQFGVGNLSSTPNQVADFLQSPPTALVTAEAVTPLEEEADLFDLTPQVVTITGTTPTTGVISLGVGTSSSTTFAYNASAATVQTSLRTITALNAVTVAGSAGGPWTVSGAQLDAIGQLLSVNSNTTGSKVVVSSPAEQPGIVPF